MWSAPKGWAGYLHGGEGGRRSREQIELIQEEEDVEQRVNGQHLRLHILVFGYDLGNECDCVVAIVIGSTSNC